MKHLTFLLAAAVLMTGCGGARSSSGPIYDLRPTDSPLRYAAEIHSMTIVETPGGNQEIEATTHVAVSLAYGRRTEAGLPFEAVFEEFATEGGVGPDFTSLLGLSFRGIVEPDGGATLTETPELDIPGFSDASILQVINPLVIPLPPEGAETSLGWPIRQSNEPGGGLSGVATFDGSARIAGDTTWNGIRARVIVSTGDLRQLASGTPAGAPGDIDLETEGESEAVYVWDPARGIVLGVEVSSEMEGSVSTQGVVLPLTIETSARYDLAD